MSTPTVNAVPGAVANHVRRWWGPGFLVVTVSALIAGAVAWTAGAAVTADALWAAGTVIAILPAAGWVIGALRHGRVGVDLIAVLALIGTLVVHEYLAGSLIAVMLATGRWLETAAQRRASHDLRALLERAPQYAHRRTGETVETVPLAEVTAGDLLLVSTGEVVGVDGRIETGVAVLDESVVTGESEQVERGRGEPVRSGAVNAGAPFELRAEATSEDSTYAGIVRLAREAGAERAPLVRLADRYAAWFLPLSLLLAGAAWIWSGSAVRAVAVLVVATPCPLLLAAPVAIVSGLSRASRRGVVIRDGAALESLGHARTLLLDKTGTLTAGRPVVVDLASAPGWQPTDVLRLAASVDQMSAHVLADAIVRHTRRLGVPLTLPCSVTEHPGRGTSGTVNGQYVTVGKLTDPAQQPAWARTVLNRAALDSTALAWVSVDGQLAGAVLLRDPLRRDAPRTLRRLRAAGLRRLVMLTGDREEPAREVATVVGLDAVLAGQSPADKVAAVRGECDRAVTVMVGDGVNDAPALAAATVGVAMGARGATASSEAADIVLTTDRLDRLADAMQTARRARTIAVQSAVAGMAMSLAAMAVAALGWLPPAPGALLQEAIDAAVILNALRALHGGTGPTDVTLTPHAESLVHRFAAEHDELRDTLPVIQDAADRLAAGPSNDALEAVRSVYRLLAEKLLPHERAEETELYPALAGPLGSAEATATMSRMHAEIERLSHRIAAHLDLAEPDGNLRPEQVDDLLACLYGLHAVLRLHFIQEEENYFALADHPATERAD